MQYINHWPDTAELTLPQSVTQDLYRQLLEPFSDESEAKEFWDVNYSTVIILDHNDSITELKESDVWNELEFALIYTEYTVPLSKGHQLLVAIVNDSGTGIFLVIPPELSHIIQEATTNEQNHSTRPEDTGVQDDL